jgi:prophage regulatory protein
MSAPSPLSPSRLLKIRDVISETSLSRRSIYRLMKQGAFPRSRRISPQRVAWSADEIDAWKRGLPENTGGSSGGSAHQNL